MPEARYETVLADDEVARAARGSADAQRLLKAGALQKAIITSANF
jgi:hypothetical protein